MVVACASNIYIIVELPSAREIFEKFVSSLGKDMVGMSGNKNASHVMRSLCVVLAGLRY